MSYGHLKVVAGPMGSSKTSTLLKEALWAKNGLGRETFVFRPTFDNRYTDSNEIVTHDGLRMPAITVKELNTLPAVASSAFVAFDEIQFFIEPYVIGDVVELIRQYLLLGIDVMVAGLDVDIYGKPFMVTAQLLAMADTVNKLNSHCAVCGRQATKVIKKNGSSDQIELGAFEKYESRCNAHWEPYSRDDV